MTVSGDDDAAPQEPSLTNGRRGFMMGQQHASFASPAPEQGRHGSRQSKGLMFGVEEEFLLVDRDTGLPVPKAPALVAAARESFGATLQPELTTVEVETNSPPCQVLPDLQRHLLRLRRTAAAAAEQCGCRLVAVGTPPLGEPPLPITARPRYLRMARRAGVLADEQAICGCHVHVQVPDRETAVQVSNHLRGWLPPLLALGANSPFHRGQDTRFASWRTMMWWRWPVAGPPPHFVSARHYDDHVTRLLDADVIMDPGMIYWDIRPSAHLPTLEVRVADALGTVDEAVLQAGLVRALVTVALGDLARGHVPAPVSDQALRAACWIAARYGLRGTGMNLDGGQRMPMTILLDRLVEHVRHALEDAGDLAMIRHLLEAVKKQGNGADRQRSELTRVHSLPALMPVLAEQTLARLSA